MEESLSDHRYVCFEFKSRKCDAQQAKHTGWVVKKFDRDAFAECISGTSELVETANWEHIYQTLNRRLPVFLMRITNSYLEDKTLILETDDGTKEIEITARVAQESVGGPTI